MSSSLPEPKPPRSFPCSSCTMCFRRAIDRDRHHRTHTGELPFECPGCKTRFARKDTLGRHLRMCRIVAAAAATAAVGGGGDVQDKEKAATDVASENQRDEVARKELLETRLKVAFKGYGIADYEVVDEAVRRILVEQE